MYSILKVNSKNNEPKPENIVIRIEVIKIISKLLDLVAIPLVVISLIVKNTAAIIGKINRKLKLILTNLNCIE